MDSELQGEGVKEIFWVEGDSTVRLAIVLRPRGNDWLEDEVVRISKDGVDTLVSMLEEDEAASLGLAEECLITEKSGLTFLNYPIPDRTNPSDISSFRKFVANLAELARAGHSIGIHCRGSIGRATVATACTLITLGWKADEALNAIEQARGCAVPDTEEQREWIRRFKVSQ